MRRRCFLAAAGAAMGLAGSARSAETKRPNLLVIETDEHNFRTLGCYRDTLPKEQALMWGDAVVETPHIDWLAEHGALCTRFYATTPVCSPSRGALVTGQYPQNTPVVQNNIPLDDNAITFAEILRRQGYATGYVGKWHLDGGGKPQWEPERKFGFEDNRYMFNRGHWKKFEETDKGPRVAARNAKGEPNYDVAGADEKSFSTDFLCDRIVDFINAKSGGAFCCMLSLPDPHGPDTVRAPYDTLYAHQTYTLPRTFNKAPGSAPKWGAGDGKFQDMAKYYGMVKCIDDNVGRILDTLRGENLLDNTLIVFTSDHGDYMGEHGLYNKNQLYETAHNVSMLMRWPRGIPGGTVVEECVSSVDVQPTILGLLGLEGSGREQGRDASPLLRGDGGHWDDEAFLHHSSLERAGIFTPEWEFALVKGGDSILFDRKNDPHQVRNLHGDPSQKSVVDELRQRVVSHHREVESPALKWL